MSATRIIQCWCEHEYQDAKHGKGRRVHNEAGKTTRFWRCTVCGSHKGDEKGGGS